MGISIPENPKCPREYLKRYLIKTLRIATVSMCWSFITDNAHAANRSIKTDDLNMVNGMDDAVVANTHLPAATITTATTTTTTTAAATATMDDAEPMTRCDCNNIVVVPPPTASQSSQSQTGVASAFPIDLTRPSYAQVAQHCRELPCTKHKTDERDRNV